MTENELKELATQKRAEFKQKKLRLDRAKIFKAFDIYKQNIAYGIDQETDEKHNSIIEWYQKCLDLDEEAIHNIPNEIRKYYKE